MYLYYSITCNIVNTRSVRLEVCEVGKDVETEFMSSTKNCQVLILELLLIQYLKYTVGYILLQLQMHYLTMEYKETELLRNQYHAG
jgi:hypothetical protein